MGMWGHHGKVWQLGAAWPWGCSLVCVGAWEGIPKPGMGFISCPAWVFCQLPASSENLKTP